VGESEEVAAFDELAKGKAAVPEENMPCHWLVVPADSPVVGQALSKSDIHRRCGVQVSNRRDGKFLRFPERKMDLQARPVAVMRLPTNNYNSGLLQQPKVR